MRPPCVRTHDAMCSHDGALHALRLTDGAHCWALRTGAEIKAAATVDPVTGCACALPVSRTLWAPARLTPARCRVVWVGSYDGLLRAARICTASREPRVVGGATLGGCGMFGAAVCLRRCMLCAAAARRVAHLLLRGSAPLVVACSIRGAVLALRCDDSDGRSAAAYCSAAHGSGECVPAPGQCWGCVASAWQWQCPAPVFASAAELPAGVAIASVDGRCGSSTRLLRSPRRSRPPGC